MGATIHVPSDYTSIQAAIDAAAPGDEIEVAPGTYYEAINFNGKAIRLYSSGGAGATTIDGTGYPHVVQCISGERPTTKLEGFTITGGNANTNPYEDGRGGGMYNVNSSPTVANCTFSGNSAASDGGGMSNYYSSPTVTDCTFSGNTGMGPNAGPDAPISIDWSGPKGFAAGPSLSIAGARMTFSDFSQPLDLPLRPGALDSTFGQRLGSTLLRLMHALRAYLEKKGSQ